MEGGQDVYDAVSRLIDRYAKREQDRGIPENRSIITDRLLNCHRNQHRHIVNCLPRKDEQQFVKDRNGRKVTARGTNMAESFWRLMKKNTPEKSGFEFAESFLLSLATHHNINREILFREQFPYFPVSWTAIIFTQCLAINGSNQFPLVPLAVTDDSIHFGLTEAFHEGIEEPPRLTDEQQRPMAAVALEMMRECFEDECLDRVVEGVLEDATNQSVEELEHPPRLPECPSSSHCEKNAQQSDEPPKKRKRPLEKKGHSPPGELHASNIFGRNIGRRYTANGLMAIWSSIFSNISPLFNPLERNLLKKLATIVSNDSGEESGMMNSTRDYPLKALSRMWNLIVVGAQGSKFATYFRPKSASQLKEELETILAVDSWRFQVKKGDRQYKMLKRLLEAAEKLPHQKNDSDDQPNKSELPVAIDLSMEADQCTSQCAALAAPAVVHNGIPLTETVIEECLAMCPPPEEPKRWVAELFPKFRNKYPNMSDDNLKAIKHRYNNQLAKSRRLAKPRPQSVFEQNPGRSMIVVRLLNVF